MKNLFLTASAIALSFVTVLPAQASSCSSLASKRMSYIAQADAAFNRGSMAVAKSLLGLAEGKSSEMRAKGCR